MAVATVNDAAVDNLRIVEFFDDDAAFNFGTKTELSLVSRDGYELVLTGADFHFNGHDRPTDGTITQAELFDPSGSLVGKIDDISHSLKDYYDVVAVGGRPDLFTADILSGDDQITGGAADDYLEGYAGDDRMSGGAGFDLLVGGEGGDSIDGGAGNDDLDGERGGDDLSGGDGFDRLYGGRGTDRLDGGRLDDRIESGGGADLAKGGKGGDVLGGGGGDDDVAGGDGGDTMYGDAGDDRLRGQNGEDSLNGGFGDDTLTGGGGHDVMFGNLGADQFRFDSLKDAGDAILDFRRGEDHLVFKASGFDNLGAGFDLVVGSDPTAATGGATFLFDTDDRHLSYDSNGSDPGGDTFVTRLDHVATLTTGDFLIV